MQQPVRRWGLSNLLRHSTSVSRIYRLARWLTACLHKFWLLPSWRGSVISLKVFPLTIFCCFFPWGMREWVSVSVSVSVPISEFQGFDSRQGSGDPKLFTVNFSDPPWPPLSELNRTSHRSEWCSNGRKIRVPQKPLTEGFDASQWSVCDVTLYRSFHHTSDTRLFTSRCALVVTWTSVQQCCVNARQRHSRQWQCDCRPCRFIVCGRYDWHRPMQLVDFFKQPLF